VEGEVGRLDGVLENETRGDVHGEEFLEEKLRGVGDHELDDALRGLAACEARQEESQSTRRRRRAEKWREEMEENGGRGRKRGNVRMHHPLYPINPHSWHTSTLNASLETINLSNRSCEAP
jgi:hypothetical protein